jgi:tetratricopeptide (TPR) repeat protein
MLNVCTYVVLALAGLAGADTWEDHFSSGEAFARTGNYAAAAREFGLALREAERFSSQDLRLVTTLTNMGVVNVHLGHYDEAALLYRRTIALYEQFHPELENALATGLRDFAILNAAERRWSSAERLYLRAYSLQAKNPGPPLAYTLNGMGELAQERRRFAGAERLYLQALSILRQFSSEALATANLQHNLATLDRETGRDAEAGQLFAQVIAAYERAAPRHPNFAIALRNYAEWQIHRGDTDGAERSFHRALDICATSLPDDSPTTGIILEAYSRFLAKMHRGTEAKTTANRARTILRTFGGNTIDWRDLTLQPN